MKAKGGNIVKIKTVCEQTGLTDRAVRYYIEEEILHPSFSENYLSRKTYDFSDKDVQMLRDIAVLRKFGFSVAQIKEMQTCPEKTYSIAEQLKEEKKEVIKTEQDLLAALEQLDAEQCYTLRELASVLSKPVTDKALPKEDTKWRLLKTTYRIIRNSLFTIIAALPIIIAVYNFALSHSRFYYPKYNIYSHILMLVLLLPNLISLFIVFSKTKPHIKSIIRMVSSVLCIVMMFPVVFFSTTLLCESETSDIKNYKRLDVTCELSNDAVFQDLFPNPSGYYYIAPNEGKITIPESAEYYYNYLNTHPEYKYDIYVAFQTDENTLNNEIKRVQSVFDDHQLSYTTGNQGNFTYLFCCADAAPFEKINIDGKTEPYQYLYYIFAYNEQTLTMRYICGASFLGGPAYFRTQDW